MQLFAKTNAKINAKNFDADVFIMVMFMGGVSFNSIGATNVQYKKGDGTRLTFLSMTLPENPKGYNRLKLHYHNNEKVDMEFYTESEVPGLEGTRVGKTDYFSEITLEYLGQAFENVMELNLGGKKEENPFE